MRMLRLSLITALLITFGSVGYANSIFTFSGVFAHDASFAEFAITATGGGDFTAYTTSWQDDGFCPTCGFQPVLSLFDSSGNFLLSGVSDTSPLAGEPLVNNEASVSWTAVAGQTYYLILTEFDNEVITGGQLTSPNHYPYGAFKYAFGPGPDQDFTSGVNQTPGGPFWVSPFEERTGNWTVNVAADETLQNDPAQGLNVVIPEPGTEMLVGGMLVLAALWRRRTQR